MVTLHYLLHHLLQNPELYEQELEKRFKDASLVSQVIKTYEEWKKEQQSLENLRHQVNQANKEIPTLSAEAKQSKIAEMKEISEKIKDLENLTKNLRQHLDDLLYQIPNLTWSGIPIGPDSDSNKEIAVYGSKPEFDFQPKNYYDLPCFQRDYLSEKGVEACGFRGYYIRGELARFQKVLFEWVLDRLLTKGFEYVIPPILVNEKVMYGTGFFPAGREDVYEVLAGDKTYFLTGTSEASLMFMYSNAVLDLQEPLKLTAQTRCFRKEAGAHGKDTRGGLRVNQFEKVETVFICRPEESDKVFEEMTKIFHETLDLLGLYYRDMEICSGDISSKNYRQIDIEGFFPAQETFRELCSSSNCTDYQTRNLNIRYRKSDGSLELTHSLNCTGITNRTMFAIMEQYQQADGKVKVPQVLVSRFGKEYLE